jgi:hypothetical protein
MQSLGAIIPESMQGRRSLLHNLRSCHIHSCSPHLTSIQPVPIVPIVVKCTSRAEANAALRLDPLLKGLGGDNIEDREKFAQAIAESPTVIADTFACPGPFYAIYNGKTGRAIFVRPDGQVFLLLWFSFEDLTVYRDTVNREVHNHFYAKYHKFTLMKHALIYMVLEGKFDRMKELGLYTEGIRLSISPENH